MPKGSTDKQLNRTRGLMQNFMVNNKRDKEEVGQGGGGWAGEAGRTGSTSGSGDQNLRMDES
jgi:hypothetical protein